MDFTAIFLLSCLKNCSRSFMSIWFTMRNHCTYPLWLTDLSSKTSWFTDLLFKTVFSLTVSCSSCLKNCLEEPCNLWFTMWDHCTYPMWFTDLPFKTSWFTDIPLKTTFSLTGGYRAKQLAALWMAFFGHCFSFILGFVCYNYKLVCV